MKKRIILFGANGFFGKNIINFFKDQHKLKKIFRKDNLDKINFKNYDFIINAAADVYNENMMFENNVVLVNQIVQKIVRENNRIRLIHFGTSGEYGAINKKSSEKDLIIPRTVYEGTKAAATMLVQSYSKYYKFKSIIIRPFSIYGFHENKTRIMPSILRSYLGLQKLKIYNGYHDYVYIKDLISFLNKLLKKNLIKNYGEIVNFGSGKQYSNKQILNFFEENLRYKSNASFVSKFQKVYDKKIWRSDCRYLTKKFNFNFKYNIYKGIKDYIKIYLNHYKKIT